MKINPSIVGEALAGTLVVCVCFTLQGLFGLPIWTIPLFGGPAVLYLYWRLGELRWQLWKVVSWVVGMSLLLFFWPRFVLDDYWWLIFVVCFFPSSPWLFWRKTKRPDSSNAGS